MKKLLLIPTLLALIALCGCVKQPSYPDIPHIELKSLSKTVVSLPSTGSKRTDTLQVTLSFTDGDGDIGIPANTQDLTCKDCLCTDHSTDNKVISNTGWNVFYYSYAASVGDSCISIPAIATKYIPVSSKYTALQGDITFTITMECPGMGTVDTLHYSFFIKDRAGHQSNRVRSQAIVVDCN